jgi:hypothetical protein
VAGVSPEKLVTNITSTLQADGELEGFEVRPVRRLRTNG